MLRDRIQAAFITLALSLGYIACSHPEPEQSLPGPVVVVGIDGAAWSAIEELWSTGRLPHLHKLAEGGIASQLIPVADASPVIWTSMATGVVPERHGITNFVVNTEMGDIPVSSTVRRVPAVWTMASAAHRRVAILGWWASWPVEEVNGTTYTLVRLGCKVALTGMLRQGHGKIFNMEGFGSDGMVQPGMAIYGATKSAVRYFTKSLVREYKDTPLIIGYMSPGIVVTDLLTRDLHDTSSEDFRNADAS